MSGTGSRQSGMKGLAGGILLAGALCRDAGSGPPGLGQERQPARHRCGGSSRPGRRFVHGHGHGGGDFDSGDGAPIDSGGYITQSPMDAPDPGPPRDIRPGSFTLEARLTADGPSLKDGVDWRIFGDKAGSDGNLPLLGQASGGVIYVRLDPGTYYIHAAFGRAGLARKIEVKKTTGGAVFVLNAGGMRLLAMNGKDTPLTGSDISFDIYAPDEGGAGDRYLLDAERAAGQGASR